MEKEKLTFKAYDREGNEVECEVLFTLQSDDTGKKYIVYTDNSTDEYGNIRTFAATYDSAEEMSELKPIETEAEWEMLARILDEMQDQEDE